MKKINTLLVLFIAAVVTFTIQPAVAQGWLDKLKDKARQTVEETVNQDAEDDEKTVTDSKEPRNNVSSPASSVSKAKPVVPQGETYGQTIGATTNLMSRWPYADVKGRPVRDVELRGVKLGMPLPDAIAVLEKRGFSKVTGLRFQRIMFERNGKREELPRDEYYNLPANNRGDVIRSIVIELEAFTPSKAIMKELPRYPEPETTAVSLTADERKRCELYGSRNRTWARDLSGAEVRLLKDKCNRMAGDNPTRQQQPRYVTRIWYAQKFISGEQVDYDLLKNRAREAFGEPTYTMAQTQYAGAAFNRQGMMWYVDSVLISEKKIREMLDKCGDDDRSMVFRDFIHPGNADNAYYLRAYQNSFDDMVEALRIAYAPHMAVGYEKGAFVVDLEWQFFSAEKSYRELWEKEKARKAQPTADIEF